MFAKFLSLADSVGLNGMSNICLPNVEMMKFGWYFQLFFDKTKNMIELENMF